MRTLITIAYLFIGSMMVGQSDTINVYVTIGEECPICIYMSDYLERVARNTPDNVRFYLVFANERSNYKTLHHFKVDYDLTGYKSILDKDQSLIKRLGATVTPEVVITNTDKEILYRGRINDAYSRPGRKKMTHPSNELDQRISLAMSNIKIPKPWPPAIGCFITISE